MSPDILLEIISDAQSTEQATHAWREYIDSLGDVDWNWQDYLGTQYEEETGNMAGYWDSYGGTD